MYIAIGLLILGVVAYKFRPQHPGIQPVEHHGSGAAPGLGWQERFLGGSIFAEGRIIKLFMRQIREIQRRNRNNSRHETYSRGFHAKSHGGFKNCKFKVVDDLPAELAVDFLQPGAELNADVRFSNAGGLIVADREKDLRGLAVRLHTEEGKVHDVLMTNGENSHVKDAWEFMQFSVAAAGFSLRFLPPGVANKVNKVLFLARLPYRVGLSNALRMIKIGLGQTKRRVLSLACESFFSRSPYAFGERACKLKFVAQTNVAYDKGDGDNYLRAELVEHLGKADVVYALKIQLWTNEIDTPLEDGTVIWTSPEITIGYLTIPQQDMTTPEAVAIEAQVEKLDFNPWYTTENMRPLGSFNRARKKVYKTSAGLRLGREQYFKKSLPIRVIDGLMDVTFRNLNKYIPWHKLWTPISALNLAQLRGDLKEQNLHDIDDPFERLQPNDPSMAHRIERTADGTDNNLNWPTMGAVGAPLGRNVPLELVRCDDENLMNPHPAKVSEMLLRRDAGFKPAAGLNLIAAFHLQMQIHGWFFHDVHVGKEWEIPMKGFGWKHGNTMKIRRDVTMPQTREAQAHGWPESYPNHVGHWWAGGTIYGNNMDRQHVVRSFKGGRLKINGNGTLMLDEQTKEPVTGMFENWSLGLHICHALYVMEHNAICHALSQAYPTWNDEALFQKARIILAGLMAKIHTIPWTTGILAHGALQVGMNANWDGLETAKLKNMLGRLSRNEVISGIIGSSADLADVPFSLTEEFTTVYRMHPLVPDHVNIYSAKTGEQIGDTRCMKNLVFHGAHDIFDDGTVTLEDVLYSFGIQNPGAITMNNHPDFMRDIEIPFWNGKPGQNLDLGALDIFKDRKRGVPRYAKFREAFRCGTVRNFAEVTGGDLDKAAKLRACYGTDADGRDNIHLLDTMPGMFAEPLPYKFGFSDLAFRVFILMASRRLEADRFFTDDFDPTIYTQVGAKWIMENDLTTVILRHCPSLAPMLHDVPNTFGVWNKIGR